MKTWKTSGKKSGINIKLVFLRGVIITPLKYFSFFFFFPCIVLSEHLLDNLFPVSNELLLDSSKTSSFSSQVYYDHTLKISRNDTTISDIYNLFSINTITIPFYSNSSISIGHKSYKNVLNIKPENNQKFSSNKKENSFIFNFQGFTRWFDIFNHYTYDLNRSIKMSKSSITAKYKNLFFGPEYSSEFYSRSFYYNSDTTFYQFKNSRSFTTSAYLVGYKNDNILLKSRKLVKNPRNKEKYNLNGLALNISPGGFQHDSEIRFKYGEISIWGHSFLRKDTTDIPILWEDDIIGRITALDDTLTSTRLGIKVRNHQVSYGNGNWSGKFWISQLFPRPFISEWPILGGTKYYLDTKSEYKFKTISYNYNYEKEFISTKIILNYYNFIGSLSGQQWAIAFPFITVLNDKSTIKINRLSIIETNIKIKKFLSSKLELRFLSNIIIPIDFSIEYDKEIDLDSKSDDDIKISGGMIFNTTLLYYF